MMMMMKYLGTSLGTGNNFMLNENNSTDYQNILY